MNNKLHSLKMYKLAYVITYMWNLKCGGNQHIYRTKTDSQMQSNRRRGVREMECEFRISRCKLLHMGWRNNKVLL